MSGSVVVDASLAIKWVLVEPYRAQARALLIDWERDEVDRLVPLLFLSELNTPLLKLRRQGAITAADAGRAFGDVLAAVVLAPEDEALVRRAFAIADRLMLRTAHDSLYVALAEREGCELWTADERFFNLASPAFPFVRWVGEVTPAP